MPVNQPTLSSTANWDIDPVIVADATIVGQSALTMFVATDNTLYVPNYTKRQILIWQNESVRPTKIISASFVKLLSIFVTPNGDIYMGDDLSTRVDKYVSATNTFVPVMIVNSSCYGLFVDLNDTLYCSLRNNHQVVKRSLSDTIMVPTIAVGTGTAGSASHELSRPYGIFVDTNFDLYVADAENDRIQLFQSGQSDGITVAGWTSSSRTISLSWPTGIVLDAQKHMFILDSENRRIVASGPHGFRCLFGTFGNCPLSTPSKNPSSLSFDNSGNIFVAEWSYWRIEKYVLLENCFRKCEVV